MTRPVPGWTHRWPQSPWPARSPLKPRPEISAPRSPDRENYREMCAAWRRRRAAVRPRPERPDRRWSAAAPGPPQHRVRQWPRSARRRTGCLSLLPGCLPPWLPGWPACRASWSAPPFPPPAAFPGPIPRKPDPLLRRPSPGASLHE